MSYNKTTVSSKTPNSTGDITLNVADVSSVSSPQADQLLSYDGSNWVNKLPNWVNTYERALNSTNGFSSVTGQFGMVLTNTGQPAGQQRFVYWHKNTSYQFTNYVPNSNNDADIIDYYAGGPTYVFYKVRINNAGLYRLFFKFALHHIYGTDSSSAEYQWSNGDNSIKYGPRIRCKKPNMKQVPCIGYINASGGEEIGLYKHALYNTPYQPLGLFQEYLMIIEKLS